MKLKIFVAGPYALPEAAALELNAEVEVPDGKWFTLHCKEPKYALRKEFERRVLVADGSGLKRDPFKIDGALVEILVDSWDFPQDPNEAGLGDLSPQIADVVIGELNRLMFPEILGDDSPFGQLLSDKLRQSVV